MADSGLARRPPLLPVNSQAGKLARRMIRQKRHAADICSDSEAILMMDDVKSKALKRLAVYLSEDIKTPYSHEPLYICCVREALKRQQKYENASLAEKHFILAAIHKAAYVLRYDLVDAVGRWDPIYGAPLTHWLANRKEPAAGGTAPAWPIISMHDFMSGLAMRLVEDGEIDFKDEIKEYC